MKSPSSQFNIKYIIFIYYYVIFVLVYIDFIFVAQLESVFLCKQTHYFFLPKNDPLILKKIFFNN